MAGKGVPKTGGRQKGTPNKATTDIKALARRLLTEKSYLQMLKTKLTEGNLPPQIWSLLYHYAYGKPPDPINLHVTVPVEQVNRLVEVLLETLTRHVKDRVILAAISSELRPLLTEASALPSAIDPGASTVMSDDAGVIS